MREHLYRGFYETNNGNNVITLNNKQYIGEWVDGNLFVGDDGECEILIGTKVVRISYPVIPETVCEFTGLTDKNGKKIFEGDIIKEDCGYEYQIGVVTFGDGYYDGGVCPFRGWFIDKFTLVREDEENDEDNFVFACDDHNSLLLIADEFEVIGNIYDNKDLLKEEV